MSSSPPRPLPTRPVILSQQLWIPPGPPANWVAPSDVEKSPLTPTHAFASYSRPRTRTTSSIQRLTTHLGGLGAGAGPVKRLLSLGVLVTVCLVCYLTFGQQDQRDVVLRKVTSWRSKNPKVLTMPEYSEMERPVPSLIATLDQIERTRPIDISSRPLPIHATTEERLDAWARAPGPDMELGTFNQYNFEQCSHVEPNYNYDLFKKGIDTWATLNKTAIGTIRQELIQVVADAHKKGKTQHWGEGRGIVFTAGNADTLQRVIWTLSLLRNVYHSTLPVQIYHFPSERLDPDNPLLSKLAELDATMVEAHAEKDTTRTKNYHLKAIAMLQSPWREVLFLDSDNIPTRDPEYIFEAPPYKRLGVMFWPDYWKTNAINPIWQLMGIKCRNEWEQEAGQILIDKQMHMDALILSEHFLKNFHYWFLYSDGDKDIFRFAFLSLRKRWAVPGRYVGVGALPRNTATGFCGLTMQHYDHLGEPLFIHSNLLKQVPSGVGKGMSWGLTKQLPTFIDDQYAPVNSTEMARGLGDVDADMLADADDTGIAQDPASFEVRKRAAIERGLRPFFHGGIVSALCIDIRQDDPRPDESRTADDLVRAAENAKLKSSDVNSPPFDLRSLSPLGIKWDESLLEVAVWKEDPLLVDFEDNIYAQGFIPSGKGF